MQETYKITREERLQMERKARRNADIEFQTPRVKYTVERSKKAYNRQEEKNFKKHLEMID